MKFSLFLLRFKSNCGFSVKSHFISVCPHVGYIVTGLQQLTGNLEQTWHNVDIFSTNQHA